MKTWYCVTSSCDDRGRAIAAITATKEAEECPKAHTQAQAEKTFIMIGLEAKRKQRNGLNRPVLHSRKGATTPPGN